MSAKIAKNGDFCLDGCGSDEFVFGVCDSVGLVGSGVFCSDGCGVGLASSLFCSMSSL